MIRSEPRSSGNELHRYVVLCQRDAMPEMNSKGKEQHSMAMNGA